MKATNKNHKICLALTMLFLMAELILYYLILSTGGSVLIWSSYISIILCFVYALCGINKKNLFAVAGLFFTVLADYCLVICNPIQQLWGMAFFLPAQICYAVLLHRQAMHKALLPIRITLFILVEAVAIIVLQDKTDALALVSVGYYVNLIMNLICAFSKFRQNKLMSIGLLCFLLCDTVIGLQIAAGAYLPITPGSLIHKIIFVDFHLSWFFYLPSQVLITLSTRKR